MKFDTYTVVARVFPGLLSIFPFFVLHYFYLRPILGKFWEEVLAIQIVSDVTISLVFLFLLIQLNRFISKEIIERKLFGEGLHYPTSNFLLHLDSYYSPEYTKKVHEKINTDFSLAIPSATEEFQNENRSRQIIREAMAHIRTKVGRGRLVGQHNDEFGFVRNMVGGSIIAMFMSIIDVVVFIYFYFNILAIYISAVLAVLYLLYLISAKTIVKNFGENYARILIQEYMAG